MYRLALPCLLLLAFGCTPSHLDLSRPVSVDELLAAWKTDAGHIRDWHGREVVIVGRGERYKTVGSIHRIELLGESSPDLMVVAISSTVDLSACERRKVSLRGNLYCEGSRVSLDVIAIDR